jgi:hypothetical protein
MLQVLRGVLVVSLFRFPTAHNITAAIASYHRWKHSTKKQETFYQKALQMALQDPRETAFPGNSVPSVVDGYNMAALLTGPTSAPTSASLVHVKAEQLSAKLADSAMANQKTQTMKTDTADSESENHPGLRSHDSAFSSTAAHAKSLLQNEHLGAPALQTERIANSVINVSSNSSFVEVPLGMTSRIDGRDKMQGASPPDTPPKKTVAINDAKPYNVGTTSPSQLPTVSVLHFVAAPGRACAHCRTVKTPLWRNGPHGPKTLCNACGVRFKLGKLQLGPNGQTLIPTGTKTSGGGGGGHKRPIAGSPCTPPKKLKAFSERSHRLPKPYRQTIKTHREHASRPPLAHVPIHKRVPIHLTNHDGALLLLQLAGVY